MTSTSPANATLSSGHHRIGQRHQVRVQGRLTWRDASGTLRFVSVVTRDVSEVDAFVECQVPASIPLRRLVTFQVERHALASDALPAALRQGKVLSAVYRIGARTPSTGTPTGYALRLLTDPTRAASRVTNQAEAAARRAIAN